MLISFGPHRPDVHPEAYVAPGAHIVGEVHLAPGASVWFGAVVRGDGDTIQIGEDANIQDGVVVHADPGFPVSVGREVTVGHRAILHGCEIGDGALIGMGSIVMNGSRVGATSILGAGSLVPEGRVIPEGVLAFGRPARVIRPLTAEEGAAGRRGALHYRKLAEAYRKGA